MHSLLPGTAPKSKHASAPHMQRPPPVPILTTMAQNWSISTHLACCIPDLSLHAFTIIHLDDARCELNADGSFLLRTKAIACES